MEKINFGFDVLLPVYNAENTIYRTLDSIANQLLLPENIIIIINGCSDKTEMIVDDFIANSILNFHKILLKNNIGLVGALNMGLNSCSSEWVARIDADDYWLKKHLLNLSNEIYSNNSNLGLIAGSSIIKNNDRFVNKSLALEHNEIIKFLQRDNPFVHSAVAYRLDAIKHVGGYRKSFIYEDYDLWIRLLSEYKGIIIDSEMCVHIRSEDTMTSKYSLSDALAERLKLQVMAIKAFGILSPMSIISINLTAIRFFYNKYIISFINRSAL
jgi:glycosyltransferase involved in cell wall biosynthesis